MMSWTEVCVAVDASSSGVSPARATAGPFAAERFAAQLLAGEPASSPVHVAERLLAVQGQDPRGARLAIRARTSGLSAAGVDRALTQDRSLVVTWLNRGTLHLVRSEDYWWLHRVTVRPQLHVGCLRILAGSGVCEADADKGVEVVADALAAGGPLTRPQLANLLSGAGLPAGAALHVMMLASLRGIAVRGPMIGAQHAYVHVRDWLGEPPPEPEPDVALAWLARRYLAGHGPALDRDLARWAGIPVGQARLGLVGYSSRADGPARWAGRVARRSTRRRPAAAAAARPIRSAAARLGRSRAHSR